MDKVLRSRRAILVFVGPALLLYVLVLLVPIIWSFGYTFFEGNPIAGFKFTGFDNYGKLFSDEKFFEAFWFGLKYSVVVTAGQIICGFLLALLYQFYLKRASALVRTLVFFPVVLPIVAISQMFVKVFAIAPQYGLLNSALDFFSLQNWIQPWLGQENTAFWVLCIMDIWAAMGFYGVLLYAGIVEIPGDLVEAAKLDGAKGPQLVRYVILPLLTPLLVTQIIFSLNGTLKVFTSVLALTSGGPGTATTPLTLYMFKTSFTFSEYGYGSTIALALTVECLIVTLLFYRYTRRDVA